LGTPLFHRVGRRLVPTVAGERLLEAAKRTLTILRRTEGTLKRIAAGQEAVLRLTTECYTAYHWLPAILEEFGRRCPKVEVQVVAEATRRPIEALLAGKIDVAIMHNPVRDDRIESTPLFEDEMVVVAAPSHPLAKAAFVRPEDFADEHLLVYTPLQAEDLIVRRVLGPAGVMPRRVTAIQLTEAMLEMVRAGLGISVLARWAAEPQVASGAVRAIRLTQHGLMREWSAGVLRQQTTPLYIREFCRLLSAGPTSLSMEKREKGQMGKRANG
jgi:LysR family transcriptional regulator for metE and metH